MPSTRPEVFELDIDGLAYVKGAEDELLQEPGATTPVPLPLSRDVGDSARECPGECIHGLRISDNINKAVSCGTRTVDIE